MTWPCAIRNKSICTGAAMNTSIWSSTAHFCRRFSSKRRDIDYVYGTHSVIAALERKRRQALKLRFFGKPNDAIKRAIEMAKLSGIPVIEAIEKRDLDRLSGGRPTNHLVLECASVPVFAAGFLSPISSSSSGFHIEVGPRVASKAIQKEALSNSLQDAQVKPQPSQSSLQSISFQSPRPIVIALDRVIDPMNVGNIIRTANFFGVKAILFTSRSRPKISGVVSKAASGAIETVNLFEIASWPLFAEISTRNGWKFVSTGEIRTSSCSSSSHSIGDSSSEFPDNTMDSSHYMGSSASSTDVIDFAKEHSNSTSTPTVLIFGAEGK